MPVIIETMKQEQDVKRGKPHVVRRLARKAKIVHKDPLPLSLTPFKFGIVLIITGVVGIFTSLTLTIDKIHVLKDPSYVPNCNINPVFSCKSVMESSQAEVFGAVPNTLFGLIGFAAVLTVGAVLLAGAQMHRRFWQLWGLGMVGGFGFMVYLIFQSVYRLGTLCLYCMTTWAILLPLIWYSVLWLFERGYIAVPKRFEGAVQIARKDHVSILLAAYLIVLVLIVQHFWYFFKTL